MGGAGGAIGGHHLGGVVLVVEGVLGMKDNHAAQSYKTKHFFKSKCLKKSNVCTFFRFVVVVGITADKATKTLRSPWTIGTFLMVFGVKIFKNNKFVKSFVVYM